MQVRMQRKAALSGQRARTSVIMSRTRQGTAGNRDVTHLLRVLTPTTIVSPSLLILLEPNLSFHTMSARVTRKRTRASQEEEEEDLPAPKRELDLDGRVGPSNAQVDSEGHAREGQAFKKDEEFWFEDGTVILVARDIDFRVYEGLLAGLSPVFRHLFTESQELISVCMRDGQTLSCPVVHVADAPEDLRHLLRACFSKRLGRYVNE